MQTEMETSQLEEREMQTETETEKKDADAGGDGCKFPSERGRWMHTKKEEEVVRDVEEEAANKMGRWEINPSSGEGDTIKTVQAVRSSQHFENRSAVGRTGVLLCGQDRNRIGVRILKTNL
ncbi:hypothetical protein ACLOJK_018416 [Asimina triloba]